MIAAENKPAPQDKPVWHPKVQALYRAAMYWGLGKRSAWALSNEVHNIATADELENSTALDYITDEALAGIGKPFVNGAALPLAAREQVPALFELSVMDHDILCESEPQANALSVFITLEELYSYGLRRKRTKDGGWKFYIKDAHDAH